MQMRTGIGFDIHKFAEGRKLMLGGIKIPFSRGLLGHSDGDVLLHAVSDAILGAMGKPDIGYYFPDTDQNLEGIDSREIIKKAVSLMAKEKCAVGNIDAVIICEEPKLLPFFGRIRRSLSELTGAEEGRIGLKAKTLERLGDIGRGEACACIVSVLLTEN